MEKPPKVEKDAKVGKRERRLSRAERGRSIHNQSSEALDASQAAENGDTGSLGAGDPSLSMSHDHHHRDSRKSWRKGGAVSAEVMERQRTLEQFLLNNSMKQLRGTGWRYYDIVSQDYMPAVDGTAAHESASDEAGAPAPASATAAPLDSLELEPQHAGRGRGAAVVSSSLQEGAPQTPPLASFHSSAVMEERRRVAVLQSTSHGNLKKHALKLNIPTIVLITCGGVRPEAQFEHFLGLAAKGFRIIAPWLPTELHEFEDYAAGIMLVLRQERVEKAHLYGLAFGAMIAQYTAYRFPRRVHSVVLAFGCAPEEEISHRIQKCVKRNDFHNSWIMRNLVGYKTSAKELEAAKPDIEPDETRLWLLVIRKFQTPKTEMALRTQSLIDYHRDIQFIPEDFAKFAKFGGRVLLIDSATEGDERLAELRLLHPDAVLHTLEAGATPLSALLRGEEIGNAIANFIGAPSREHIAEQQRKLEEKVKKRVK